MKILWMSDSPDAPSGYGNIARHVCAGLAARGHEVSILGWQTRRRSRWRGCRLYPVGQDPFGADVLEELLRSVQPDVLITTADPWRVFYVANAVIGRCRRAGRIPWALYTGIDSDVGDGQPPPSQALAMQVVDLPLAMSRYGLEVIQAGGAEGAYVPVGVDLQVFRPPVDKAAAKRRWGYGGKFVVLSDARNQPRKLLPRALDVFRRFAAGKKDVLLHLHCDPEDSAASSEGYRYRIRADVAYLGLEEKVAFTPKQPDNRGLTLARLGTLYRAADVHFLSSYGEGFGLPTLQAAAAGLPPLAVDYSASAELVRGHGEAVRVRHYVPGAQGLRMAYLDVEHAAECLERLYRDRPLLAEKSRASRRFAEGYSWDSVVGRWEEILTEAVPRLRDAMDTRLQETGVPACYHTRPPSAGVAAQDPEAEAVSGRLEAMGGYLAAEFLRDVARSRGTFSLPVALPGPPGVKRVIGRVLLAGERDLPVFHRLREIFPGLSLAPVAEAPRAELLATSTLALDVEGCDPSLPAEAARAGVPCVAPARNPHQAALWPRLSLDPPDERAAVEIGRWMLTDQGAAAEACDLAARHLQEAG